jgi:hypothetical protein
MHGRDCAGLLAFVFLSASLMLAQSSAPRRDEVVRQPSTESSDVQQPTIPQSNARPAVAAIPRLPRIHRDPMPQPVPWGGPISLPLSGFARLAQKAGIIFSGTVTSIAPAPANVPGQAVGTVAITFHVETALRGANAGKSLTITQWIGLWTGGQRYHLGEHLLLFLYPRSRLGLTSCVASAMGRFAVDSSGNISLSPQQISAFRTDAVLGGKSHVPLRDFASAVRLAGEEE